MKLRNVKTTVCGVLALGAAVYAVVMGKGDTVDWNAVLPAALAAFGLIFARDEGQHKKDMEEEERSRPLDPLPAVKPVHTARGLPNGPPETSTARVRQEPIYPADDPHHNPKPRPRPRLNGFGARRNNEQVKD